MYSMKLNFKRPREKDFVIKSSAFILKDFKRKTEKISLYTETILKRTTRSCYI